MQFKIKKSLIITLFITTLTFQGHLYSSTETHNIDDYGIITLMYHRFEENKYPSTNIRMNDFLHHLKIIEENSIAFINPNNFEYELPNSKRKIGFKLLTHKDEMEINEILKSLEKAEKITGVSSEVTTRLKYQIASIDGNTEQKTIDNFVDNEFLAIDAREYRKYVQTITPDIDLTFNYTSGNGNTSQVGIPLGIDFFWPAAGE